MASSGPTLGDTYTLMELPRTPDLSLSQRIVVAEAQKAKKYDVTETIDVGISKSIIASYVLKPSPKLVWSYPLSPSTIVNSLDVNSLDGAEHQLYAVGITQRKKSSLLLLEKRGNETTRTTQLDLPKAAVAVRFSASKTHIYVLLKNGEFVLLTFTAELAAEGASATENADAEAAGAAKPSAATFEVKMAAQQGNVTSLAKRSGAVEFHSFIPGGTFGHQHELLFCAVRSASRTVTYRLLALNGAKSHEIYQVSSDAEPAALQNSIAYSQGMLYVHDAENSSISSRSLMTPQTALKHVSVGSLLPESTPQDLVSIYAVATDRLLLSYKSSVFLINFKFESLLSEHTNNSGNHVYLGFALPVEGKSANTTNSFALYLNLEDKTKLCKLKSIQVDVGLNLLSESLGKAIKKATKPEWSGLTHLVMDNLAKHNSRNLNELHQAYRDLASHAEQKNAAEFDARVLAFFKSEKKSSKESVKFSETSDRIVDNRFIESVISLFLTLNEDSRVAVISEDFLPKKAMSYLLSHPLFPVQYTEGLLVLLSALEQPELLKQAIKNCRALTLDELMAELTNLTEVSEEIDPENAEEVAFVKDFLSATINRILKDYSLDEVTKKLSELLTAEYETDSKKLERMLNVLINLNSNSSWSFVQAVIDVGGLFNWTVPTIDALSDVIDAKVAALSQNSFNLTLTNQALASSEHKKKNKKAAPKVVDNIHEVAGQRAQLDALLTISNNTSNKKLLADESIDLAKQIPTYSRERLII